MLERGYASLPEKVFKSERFEVPVVDAFIQGSKTLVRNFDFISQKLRRKPADVAKYLFRELAARGDFEGARLVLHGKFSDRVLNERIQAFTKTYVLCKECGKPDTNLKDVERGVKQLICEACGARASVKAL